MFYSQRSRKILKKASMKYWIWDIDKKSEEGLFSLINKILNDKYMKKNINDADYKKLIDETFTDKTFTDMLENLNKIDKVLFPYNPSIHSGDRICFYIGKLSEVDYMIRSDHFDYMIVEDNLVGFYIGRLYEYLYVDYMIFEYNLEDNHLFYSYWNIELFNNLKYYEPVGHDFRIRFRYSDSKYIDIDNIPEILIVSVHNNCHYNFYKETFPNMIISDGDTKKNITSMNDKIFYRGREYHLDYVLLRNYNDEGISQTIAGITCKNKKYVYNGLTRTSMDPAMKNVNLPCGLMLHDWKIKGDEESGDRCININNCTMDPNLQHHNLCFNFSKGIRILVYVLAENISVTSKSVSEKSPDLDL